MFWETGWTDKKALVGLILHECSYSFNFFFPFCECITGQGKICLQDWPVVDSWEVAS